MFFEDILSKHTFNVLFISEPNNKKHFRMVVPETCRIDAHPEQVLPYFILTIHPSHSLYPSMPFQV